MATLREFVTKWGFDVDESQLDKIDQGVSRVQKNIRATAQAATELGKRLSLGVTLPFVGISAAAIKAASDSEETLNKFNVVFQDVRGAADLTAENLAQNFGLASDKAKALLADTGDLLSGFGFTGESALKLSKQVQELAVDLASFTNFSGGAEGASAALTKALLGERESVKALGIAILEEDVKAKVKALEAAGRFTTETERERKAIATLEIALSQSKNAIGDFERSSKSFANQTRILGARVRDVAVSFGEILLPIANRAVQGMTKVVSVFRDMSPAMRTTILVIGGIAAAIGPLLIIAGTMTQAFLNIRLALMLVGNAALKTFAIMAAKILLVVAVLTVVALAFDDLKAFFQGRDSLFGVLVQQVDMILEKFQTAFPTLSKIVLAFVGVITAPFKFAVGLVRGLSAAVGTLFGGGGVLEALDNFAKEFGSAFSDIAKIFGFLRGKVGLEDVLGIKGIRKGTEVEDLTPEDKAEIKRSNTIAVDGPREPTTLGERFGIETTPRGIESAQTPDFNTEPVAAALAEAGFFRQPGQGIPGIEQARAAGQAANKNNVTQNVNAPVTVNVPPGTNPDQVGPFVQSGVKEALGQQLREAGRQAQGAVVN